MKLINSIELIIKKSKFLAYHYKIDNLDEVKIITASLKKSTKKLSISHSPTK